MLTDRDIDDMRPMCAGDLDTDALHRIHRKIGKETAGQPFAKKDVTSILVSEGFPEWKDGKRYAMGHTGSVLKRLADMGLVEKSGTGKWVCQ